MMIVMSQITFLTSERSEAITENRESRLDAKVQAKSPKVKRQGRQAIQP